MKMMKNLWIFFFFSLLIIIIYSRVVTAQSYPISQHIFSINVDILALPDKTV